MKLIVGLGNPGRKYERTRHNLGFLLIDRLAARAGADSAREDCDALVYKAVLAERKCLLAKPQTFMNLSGRSVSRLVAKHYIEASVDLLVISDDVALPIGKMRLRARGSAGGHNGLKSIIAELGHQDFPRLRLGIQSESPLEDLADFVLAKFEPSERETVEAMLERAESVAIAWLQEGIERAMATANNKQESEVGNRKRNSLLLPTSDFRLLNILAPDERDPGLYIHKEDRNLRTYEVPFIVAPNVADDEIERLIGQFEQAVAEKGGKVVKVERIGRRRLAYPIRKFREGTYVLLIVEGSGQEIAELERRMRVTSDLILRYITVRIDEDLKRAEKVRAKRQSRIVKRPRKGEHAAKERPGASADADAE